MQRSSRHSGGNVAKQTSSEQILQGTLDLLILKTLSLAPMHGWGLTHRIEQLSQDVLQVGQGSIYPALVRLEQRGWMGTGWRTGGRPGAAAAPSITASQPPDGEPSATSSRRGTAS